MGGREARRWGWLAGGSGELGVAAAAGLGYGG